MSTRKIKDAKDLSTNELIYFKGHAKATYMSDGRTVEEAVNGMSGGSGGGSIDTSNFATKDELAQKQDVISDIDTIRTNAANYKGTVTSVKINGVSKSPSNGVIDLGTVITSHQDISGKQDKLVSGTNIKTINNTSILGSGNISITGGGGSGTITGVSANGTSIATSGVANIPAASTSAYGVTKLSSATNSTSTSLAATASAVKSAYDLANGKQDKLVSGSNIKTINGQTLLGSGNIAISGVSGGGGEDIRFFADFTVERVKSAAPSGSSISYDATAFIDAARNNKLICVPYADVDKGYAVASYKFTDDDVYSLHLYATIFDEGANYTFYAAYTGDGYAVRGHSYTVFSTQIQEVEVVDGEAIVEGLDNTMYYVTDVVEML